MVSTHVLWEDWNPREEVMDGVSSLDILSPLLLCCLVVGRSGQDAFCVPWFSGYIYKTDFGQEKDRFSEEAGHYLSITTNKISISLDGIST